LIGLFCVALVAVVLVGTTQGASAATGSTRARVKPGKVLIISAPRLTWADVQEVQPPNLDRLFARSALALMSVRVVSRSTSPGSAYLTLGAGNRARSDVPYDGQVLDQGETFDGSGAKEIYQRLTGVDPTKPILALGFPRLHAINKQEKFGTQIGLFATTMEAAGHTVSAIGNADLDPADPHRQAGLFAADRTGQVKSGAVDSELLVSDGSAPFGLRYDHGAVVNAFTQSWAHSSVELVELSDLERAEKSRVAMTKGQASAQYKNVLTESDELVGQLLSKIDPRRDTVIVLGPTAPLSHDQMTVFSIAGPGISPGWATSSTTRRDRYVTLTDVAPTLLDHFGLKVPDAMTDTLISTDRSSDPVASRINALAVDNNRTLVRDGSFGSIAVAWVILLIADLVMAAVCLAGFPRLSGLTTVLALIVLSLPSLAFLEGLLPIQKLSSPGFALVLYASAVVVAVAGAWFGRRRPVVAPVALIGLLWLVLAVDIVTGGNLQINTVFGYSPIVAGRFAGFGNQAFSLFAISAVILVTVAWEHLKDRFDRLRWFLLAAAVFLLVSIVLDGFPGFGSDVGGVLALVPTSVVLLMTMAGKRVRVRTVGVIAAGTLAVLAAFAAIDLSRPAKERTHLGRFVAQLFNGDGVEVVQRKLETNWSVFTSSFLTWVIPVAMIYIAYLWWKPTHTLEVIRRRYPGFRLLGVAGLMLGVLSMALNDSGVSMPAVMLMMGLAYTTILALGVEAAP
jgi:hypothetical protein